MPGTSLVGSPGLSQGESQPSPTPSNIPIRCPGDVSVALAGPRSVLQSMSPEARGQRVDAMLQSRTKSHRIETATDAAGKPAPMGGMIREAARADRCDA